MEKLSSFGCFQRFCENPKLFNMDVIQGSHKFLVEVIRGEKESPTNATLINIFNAFCSKGPIKKYVFNRLGKKILQELALCILQDLASNGPARARTLELEVVKASSGGKLVQIADHYEDDAGTIDQSFLDEIDEAIFRFKDPTGESPDVKISSGQGFAAPYLPPDEEGAFVTPTKKKPRSLAKEMGVSFLPVSRNFNSFQSLR